MEEIGKKNWDTFSDSFREKYSDDSYPYIKNIFDTIEEINVYIDRFSNLYNDLNHSYRIIYYLEELILTNDDVDEIERFLLYLSAFLHDLGKPNPENIPDIIYKCLNGNTENQIESETIINTIFNNHNKISACLLNVIGKEKQWPNQILDALKFICEGHNMGHQNSMSLDWIKHRLRNIEVKHIHGFPSVNYPLINTNVNLEKIVIILEMADTIEDFQPFRSIDSLLLKIIKPPIVNDFRERILKKAYIQFIKRDDDFLLLLDIPSKIKDELNEKDIEQLCIYKDSVRNKYNSLRHILKWVSNKRVSIREIDTHIAGLNIEYIGG